LLVSHWKVASGLNIKLITKAIAELRADPEIGRAEVSMIIVGAEHEAHPAFRAPFELVGEGGAARISAVVGMTDAVRRRPRVCCGPDSSIHLNRAAQQLRPSSRRTATSSLGP
jgi:hypothetical protein